ncbi:MAG: hypothetical protein ABEJ04_02780 [Halobacteriaceae archaeon]
MVSISFRAALFAVVVVWWVVVTAIRLWLGWPLTVYLAAYVAGFILLYRATKLLFERYSEPIEEGGGVDSGAE